VDRRAEIDLAVFTIAAVGPRPYLVDQLECAERGLSIRIIIALSFFLEVRIRPGGVEEGDQPAFGCSKRELVTPIESSVCLPSGMLLWRITV
jgi:hypothetical protein